MRPSRHLGLPRVVAPLVAAAALLAAPSARAIEFKDLGGLPLTVDVTNTAITSYRFDNRNDFFDGQRKPDPRVKVDDNYFDYTDRLNVQLGYWRFRFAIRLDGQAYGGIINQSNAVRYVVEETQQFGESLDSNRIIGRANEYLGEVNTRFRAGLYPAKLSLSYQQPGVDITAGDFYAQLGRGLVLSVRKLDELATDTTIRGGKIQASRAIGSFRIGGTLLAGQFNPQRVDEQSGRMISATASPLFFGFPEPNQLRLIDSTTGRVTETTTARPNFLPDTVVGGRVEGGHTLVQVAANVAVVLRDDNSLGYQRCFQAAQDDAARAACNFSNPVLNTTTQALSHSQIRNFSGSITLPQLGKYADLYAEVAGQQLTDGTVTKVDAAGNVAERQPDLDGYAVYVNANARLGPLTLSLEGKHNRRFYPLSANVNADFFGHAAPEFSLLSYSAPPTAEPIYVEPVGQPNVCNTGGRAQAQFRLDKEAAVYGWVGRYSSWSEYGENPRCDETDAFLTKTWDSAVGADLGFEEGRSYAKAWAGTRVTDLEVPTDGFVQVPGTTAVFYREAYVRYDLVKHLSGAFSLQSQGFHRHRYLPERFGDPWWEGENYLALQWAPRLSAAFGFEYTSRPGCSRDAEIGDFCFYTSGGLLWRGAASDGVLGQVFNSVALFVGQRRAAIRCVSGVCRQFPPFEGARLEVVSRF